MYCFFYTIIDKFESDLIGNIDSFKGWFILKEKSTFCNLNNYLNCFNER